MPGSSWQEFRGREASWVSKELESQMASVYSGSVTYGWSSTSLCLRFYKICKVGEITTSS